MFSTENCFDLMDMHFGVISHACQVAGSVGLCNVGHQLTA
jgi:hypothetical protein